jgi:hypothetical protein
MPRVVTVATLLLLVAATFGGSTPAALKTTVGSVPLIGANYTHYVTRNCGLRHGIITHYNLPGVRRRVRAQLAAMRAAGIQSLRLLLWYMTDATGQTWGIVSSNGGHLAEPYRSNLIHYLSDVTRAGFEQLTLSFAPEWTSDPLMPNYDPSLFDEDWELVRDVVPLVKQYGPPSTRIDLQNEGAPPSWLDPAAFAEAEDWITRMWSNYADTFGSADASISSVGAHAPRDTTDRVQNLIEALQASGRPLPGWFDIHPAYDYDGTLSTLQAVDALLTRDGLSQPLVVGEEAYNDKAVAQAVAQFMATSSRRVLEVMEWPQSSAGTCPSAPFRAGAYISVLSGSSPSSTLTAGVTPNAITFQTPSRQPVSALEANRYEIVVHDNDGRAGFGLVGPGVSRQTGSRFRGTATWRLVLRPGTYRYGPTGASLTLSHRISVLKTG